MLGNDDTGGIELVNVGNVVVLGQVNSESCAHQEIERAPYDSHLKISQSLIGDEKLRAILVVSTFYFLGRNKLKIGGKYMNVFVAI